MHGKFPNLAKGTWCTNSCVRALALALALARTMRSAIMMMIRSRYTSSSLAFSFLLLLEVANGLHRLLGLGR